MSLLKGAPFALVAFVACAPYRPPFTQTAGVAAARDSRQATVVFLWPSSSCDPAGYFTLATSDGRFLGNISRDSRLSVSVPAGESTIVGWDEDVESASGWMKKATVPVLHADLREGHTYYVRLMFGEWDDRGPVQRWTRMGKGGVATRSCVAVTESTTSAMVAVSPTWHELAGWMADLHPTVPDHAAGQAWLDANHAAFESHLTVGEDRFFGFRPEAKLLATLEPKDGAPQ
jgi:hypothetical protein